MSSPQRWPFRSTTLWRILVMTMIVGGMPQAAQAQEDAAAEGQAEPADKHRQIVQQVLDRLLQHVEKPEIWSVWPPELEITDPGFANAYAGLKVVDGVETPFIIVTVTEIEEVAEFDEDILAYTLGHELGHLIGDHSRNARRVEDQVGNSEVTLIAVTREQELEADLYGAELILRAGYSMAGLMRNVQNTMGDNPYCNFEGLGVSHPSWPQRAEFMQTDDVQRRLWRSMAAFRNGVFFLQNEQYLYAEVCFRKVTEEFPNCYEAWANLGYARLMQWCDSLDADDIRMFDIGHLVVGGFYRRPVTLEGSTRGGADPKLWWGAVGALRDALRIQQAAGRTDGVLLIKANLAVAYLVHPDGKDGAEAERYFSEVLKGLENPSENEQIDPVVRAAIVINAGAGRLSDSSAMLERALREVAALADQSPDESTLPELQAAIGYNQAKTLLASSKSEDLARARELLERYLRTINPASAWWSLAYDEYVKLAQVGGETPLTVQQFVDAEDRTWRPVTRVDVGEDLWIGLGEPVQDMIARLGEPDSRTKVARGTKICLIRYEQFGISVLASREVLAVMMTEPGSPPVMLQKPGLGSQPQPITVGMPAEEAQTLLGSEWDSEAVRLYDPKRAYHLYRAAGVAVRYEDGVVAELVAVVAPVEEREMR